MLAECLAEAEAMVTPLGVSPGDGGGDAAAIIAGDMVFTSILPPLWVVAALLFAPPYVHNAEYRRAQLQGILTRYCKQSMVLQRIAAFKPLFKMGIGDNIKLMCCYVFATLCLIFGVCFYLF